MFRFLDMGLARCENDRLRTRDIVRLSLSVTLLAVVIDVWIPVIHFCMNQKAWVSTCRAHPGESSISQCQMRNGENGEASLS